LISCLNTKILAQCRLIGDKKHMCGFEGTVARMGSYALAFVRGLFFNEGKNRTHFRVKNVTT
jgi:hypothetical protein